MLHRIQSMGSRHKPVRIQMHPKRPLLLSPLLNRKGPRFNWSSISLSRSTTTWLIHK